MILPYCRIEIGFHSKIDENYIKIFFLALNLHHYRLNHNFQSRPLPGAKVILRWPKADLTMENCFILTRAECTFFSRHEESLLLHHLDALVWFLRATLYFRG